MKVELLKNKENGIIEKVIINRGISHQMATLPFNLQHNEVMVNLDEFQLKWHELIMDINENSDICKIESEAKKDFDEITAYKAIKIAKELYKYHVNNADIKDSIEMWFTNYYRYCLFYAVLNLSDYSVNKDKYNKTLLDNNDLRVVDPMIILYADECQNLIDTTKEFTKANLVEALVDIDNEFKNSKNISSSKDHYNNVMYSFSSLLDKVYFN